MSRWAHWQPQTYVPPLHIEPAKPPKPPSAPGIAGFDGFAGSPQGAVESPRLDVAISLRGAAVELWRDGRRFFVVADEHDAQLVMQRLGAARGEVWTGGELELVASITDQAIRDEVAAWKRANDGRVREFWPKGEPR